MNVYSFAKKMERKDDKGQLLGMFGPLMPLVLTAATELGATS